MAVTSRPGRSGPVGTFRTGTGAVLRKIRTVTSLHESPIMRRADRRDEPRFDKTVARMATNG